MSIIATDGITIAADGLAIAGDEIVRTDATKLFIRGGNIYSLVGSSAYGLKEALIAWHLAGAKVEDVPKHGDWSLIVIDASGQLWAYHNEMPYGSKVPYPAAFGSGERFALGAMKAGAKPWRAVEIAIESCTTVGGTITEINIADAVLRPAAEKSRPKAPKFEVV